MTDSIDILKKNRDASAAKLRRTLDEIPGAREAFVAVLNDPKTREDLGKGVGVVMGLPGRAKEVGWLVAIAEIEEKDIRMAAAKAIQAAVKIGRSQP